MPAAILIPSMVRSQHPVWHELYGEWPMEGRRGL